MQQVPSLTVLTFFKEHDVTFTKIYLTVNFVHLISQKEIKCIGNSKFGQSNWENNLRGNTLPVSVSVSFVSAKRKFRYAKKLTFFHSNPGPSL